MSPDADRGRIDLSDVRRSAAVAVAVVLAQVAASMALSSGSTLEARYRSLLQWDSRWYESIAARGYRTTIPPAANNPEVSNVAFFPGYPVAARLVAAGLRVDAGTALLVTAQAAAAVFFTCFALLLKSLGLRSTAVGLGMAAVALYPSSFFLVAGYSESLFLAAATGFLLALLRRGPRARLAAVASGIVMTATRAYAVALLPLPIAWAALSAQAGRRWRAAAAAASVSLGASAGILGFFAYCRWRFGQADIYAATQRAGWGVELDWRAPLRLSSYYLCSVRGLVDAREQTWDYPECLNRSAVVVMLVLLYFAGRMCLRMRRADRERFPPLVALLAASAGIFFFSVASLASWFMGSMIRQTLPSFVFAVPIFAVYLGRGAAVRWPARLAVAAFLAASCALHLFLLKRFVLGIWVA